MAAPTTLGGGDTADLLAQQLLALAKAADGYLEAVDAGAGEAAALVILKAAIVACTDATYA